MYRLVLFTSLTTLVLAAPCYDECRFAFCEGHSTFDMTDASTPFSGALCTPRGERVSVISDNSTCEAMVKKANDESFTSISGWRPEGLTVPFPRDFFKLMNSPFTNIARRTWKGNQKEMLNNKCLIMPVDAWRLFDKNGIVAEDEIYTRHNNMEDCVSFFARTL